jgi:hypothetical protein
MFKKLLFKTNSFGFVNKKGEFIKTEKTQPVGGVLIHESEWDKYDFRITGNIPQIHTVDYSLKFRQDEIAKSNQIWLTLPEDLKQYFQNRAFN